MAYQFDTTVLGGLPVTIEFDETGLNCSEWDIVAVNSRPCKTYPKWLHNRLTHIDAAAISEQCVTEYYKG